MAMLVVLLVFGASTPSQAQAGPTPEISVEGNGFTISDGSVSPLAANHTNFGNVNIMSGLVTRTFTIRNTGTIDLNLTGAMPVTITGSNADEFDLGTQPTGPIAPGGTATFDVVFDPDATGTFNATINIANDDSNENPYNFAIRATGFGAPEISVKGGAFTIGDGDVTPTAADDTDFGNVNIMTGSVTKTFTIRNTGTINLNLIGAAPITIIGSDAGEFDLGPQPTSSIAPGSIVTFDVTFDPDVIGTFNATVVIANDDANENPFNFAIRATGSGAAEIALEGNGFSISDGDPSPSLADGSNFGTVNTVAGSVTRTFTIRNTGTINLNLTGTTPITITGSNADKFDLGPQPTSPIAPGGAATFYVKFDPDVAGTFNAMVRITNDDANENPYNFAITARGQIQPPPILAVASGGSQSAEINKAFVSPLVVTVKTSSNNPVSGVDVTFTAPATGAAGIFAATGTSTQTVTTNALGVATSSVFSANGITGNYDVDVTSSGLSDVTFAMTNTKAAQTITFAGPADTDLTSSPVTVAATASSNLDVTFAAGPATVCNASDQTITLNSVGTCTVTASQVGNAGFDAAGDVVRTFDVTQGTNIITFTGPTNTPLAAGSVTVAATASSGLDVKIAAGPPSVCGVIDDNDIIVVSEGPCTVTASQAGNANFDAAVDVVRTFDVIKNANIITFVGPTDTPLLNGTVNLSASATSGLAVIFATTTATICTVSGNSVTLISAGTCLITASQAGDANFVAATDIVQAFEVIDATNIITFEGPTDTPLLDRTVALSATATSGLAVKFASTTRTVCTVTGNTVTLAAIGRCSITASQEGRAGVPPASDVVQSFAVTKDGIVDRMQRVISNFVSRRADQITANEPNIVKRLSERASNDGDRPVALTSNGTGSDSQFKFATSLRSILASSEATRAKRQRREGLQSLVAAQQNSLHGGLVNQGFDIWVQGKLIHVDSETSKSDIGLLYVGAEYRFSSTLLVGILAQYDWTDEEDTTEDIAAEGTGWMVGPYLVARLHENLLFDGRISFGKSDNEVDALGFGTDNFEGRRWLIKGQLTGDFDIAGAKFEPHVGLIYFEEEQKGFTNNLNVFIPNQTISLGRITFGPRLSTSYMTPDGITILPYLSLKGIWDFEKAEIVDLATGLASGTDDLRGRVEGGLSVSTPSGIGFSGEGFYDGIGSKEFAAYGGSLTLSIPLN